MAADGEETGDAVIVHLRRWTAETRSDAAAERRRRERWLRQQAEGDATFAGLALDLAERAATATVRTVTGRRHTARVAAAGADFLALEGRGQVVFVPLRAVAELVPADRPATAPHARPAPTVAGPSFATVLANLAEERASVSVVAGAATVAGDLRAAGADVLTLRRADAPAQTVYVPVASVTELSVRVSG